MLWETDAHPRLHPEGPQGLIDDILHPEDCDLLIGIFWKRFGTPTATCVIGYGACVSPRVRVRKPIAGRRS